MGLNLSNLETVLQTKVNGLTSSSTDKDVLLTSKSIEAATADVTVSDIITEGAVQTAAAAAQASNAAGSATTATTQAGIATTKAGEAATSKTGADTAKANADTAAANALSSKNSAATSAATATTKASEASTSATTATTKAGEASTSASAAATSASSAASAATTAVNAVIDTAPANLNTLNELAEALGDDANYAATTATALGNRYTKTETDAKIVELAPATDISGKLDKTGGTMTGSLHMGNDTGITSITSGKRLRVSNPGGGAYSNTGGLVTGAIKVRLPVEASAPGMFSCTISVYEYSTHESFEIRAGGHNVNAGDWHNCFAYMINSPAMTQSYAVRFGYTATNEFIMYIGELSSSWSYPQVSVTNVEAGYVSTSHTAWDNNWNIQINGSPFENVSRTIAAVDVKAPTAGKVLQVVSTERRSHLSVTADNTADWITLTITPTSTTSKIKLSVMGGVSSSNTNNFSMLLLHRDNTNLAYGDAVGTSIPCWIDIGCRDAGSLYVYQQKQFAGVYIDSPNTTNAITYKVKVRSKVNGTIVLGRTANLSDSNRTTTMGWLIAEEIGA